jgi:hypothetical protein
MVVGISLAIGALLAAVLPTRQQYALTTEHPPDVQSLGYLEVLTRASPSDESLRLVYVRQLAALGRFSAALEALGPASPADRDPRTVNLRFDLLLASARSIPEGTAERAAAFDRVKHELKELRTVPQTPSRLRELAAIALELGEPYTAAEYLLGVATLSPPRDRPPVLAAAAAWLRAANDGTRAAMYFREAADGEADRARASTYASAAVDALEANDNVGGAAEVAASYAERFAGDASWLERAAKLATAADRPYAARDLGRRLIGADPENEPHLVDQVRRELSASDPRGALVLVKRIAAMHPDEPHWRHVEARIAEWAGDPALALGDWLWLLGRGVDLASDRELP